MKMPSRTSNLRKIDWILIAFLFMVSLMVWSPSTHHPFNTTKATASVVTHPIKNTQASKIECSTCSTPAEAMIAILQGQYMVKHKDTMYSIAKKYGINAQQLYAMNDIPYGGIIRPGELLNVPKK